MARSIEDIAKDFQALSGADFDPMNENAKGMERLQDLTKEILELSRPDQAAEILLSTLERLSKSPEIDARFDLGTPGPFVHTLESLPGYEKHLELSVKRYPTPLTLWMINRILNATQEASERSFWLLLLEQSLNHPQATEAVLEEARDFLEFQKNG